jgi:hypothetical protein
MARVLWVAPLLIGASLLASCGSSDTGGGTSGTVPLDQLAPELAKTECGLYEKCVGSVFGVLLGGEDCVTLTERRIDNGGVGALSAAVNAGTVKYDGAKAAACLKEIAGRDCSQLDDRSSETCDQAAEGSVAVGGDCNYDFDCQGLNYCKFSGSCPGKCAPHEAAGGTCAKNDDCQDGLICSKQNACVKPAALGEACGGGVQPDCASTLFCIGDDAKAQKAGTCQDVATAFSAKAGDTCSYATGPLCTSDLVCVYDAGVTSGTCQAKVASGAACKRVAVPGQCPSDPYCDGSGQTLDGTCKQLPGDGQPCAQTPIGNLCAAYTRCQNGSCVSLQGDGGPCSQDDVCYSQRCVQGVCKANACN